MSFFSPSFIAFSTNFYFSERLNHNIVSFQQLFYPSIEERVLQINLLHFLQQDQINRPLLEKAQLVCLHELLLVIPHSAQVHFIINRPFFVLTIFSNTNTRQFSIYFQTVLNLLPRSKVYNSPNSTITASSSSASFKRKLKEFLLSTY